MNGSIRAGLVVLGIVSVGDIAGLALTDGHHPPYAVAVVGALLGIVSLYLIARAWQGRRSALRPLIVLRVISALTAVPAFFAGDVPAGALIAAVVIVALTAVGVVLLGRPSLEPVTS